MSPSILHRFHTVLRWLTHASFAAFLILALATHSAHWRVGPFTWLPLLRLPALLPARAARWGDEQPMVLGILTLIPLLLAVSWPLVRLVELRIPGARRWQWGWRHFALPLGGLTLLGLVSIGWSWAAAGTRMPPLGVSDTAFQLLSLALVWATYLFLINERPSLTWPLAAVVAIQSLVGVAQFVRQADLGLTVLGELDLDPAVSGVSVLMADGQRWLRAYGLTGHPNLLAALIAPLILYLLSQTRQAAGWRRWTLLGIVGLGAVALVATASRAAWLAFGLGLALWLAALWSERRQAPRRAELSRDAARRRRRSAIAAMAVAGGLALLFLAVYGPLLLTRFFNLDTSIEARSLFERERDWGIAWQLIRQHPVAGVGMGSYLLEARAVDQAARVVHNVPLLVTAELGLLAGLLWLWLTGAPFVAAIRQGKRGWFRLTPGLAPWVAVVTMGLFHGLPWINTGWRAAILMALILGILANEISGSESGVSTQAHDRTG